MRIDWRRDGGGIYRVLSDDGRQVGMFTEVTIETGCKLVSERGHGWLVVDGEIEANGHAAKITGSH